MQIIYKMIGNKYTTYKVIAIREKNIYENGSLSYENALTNYQMICNDKSVLKAELLEETHIEETLKTYVNQTKTNYNKRMLEEMQRNNKAVKQLCLLLGV